MTVYSRDIGITLPWHSRPLTHELGQLYIILVTMLRTTSGCGPKPCMDLDFTHAIKMSGTTQKITRVCAVVTGQYCR